MHPQIGYVITFDHSAMISVIGSNPEQKLILGRFFLPFAVGLSSFPSIAGGPSSVSTTLPFPLGQIAGAGISSSEVEILSMGARVSSLGGFFFQLIST